MDVNDFLGWLREIGSADGGASPPWFEIIGAVLQSFALALIIGATYRRTYRGQSFSQDYIHTLIILSMGVTIVMMVVQGNPATAFGMFAAFSIIRFRRTVNQARDIAFVFLAMASGMAIGARHYMIGWATVILICAIIYLFSKGDIFAPSRISHLLRMRVNNDINYDTAFQSCFQQQLLRWDLISVESVQAGLMTELRFNVTLKDPKKPSALVAELQLLNGNNRILLTSASPEVCESE